MATPTSTNTPAAATTPASGAATATPASTPNLLRRSPAAASSSPLSPAAKHFYPRSSTAGRSKSARWMDADVVVSDDEVPDSPMVAHATRARSYCEVARSPPLSSPRTQVCPEPMSTDLQEEPPLPTAGRSRKRTRRSRRRRRPADRGQPIGSRGARFSADAQLQWRARTAQPRVDADGSQELRAAEPERMQRVFGNLPPYLRQKRLLRYPIAVHVRRVADFSPRTPSTSSGSPSTDGDSFHPDRSYGLRSGKRRLSHVQGFPRRDVRRPERPPPPAGVHGL
ncbi:nascent polypeptide-associated complex subunit alpha, muscle-specific form-like [Panicum miliaceum]|uniref:Nascent polypeptide-associated complex subunit alpha, muscle-specific form-like n=1 Tax=Panicum miliaceum TaxID=4540 RepID=A0A3L6QSM6_PANMI|nr:nascent polypeptide-associated complex subunit alpha, muscle-specific form-like [Panicum miliaceum]